MLDTSCKVGLQHEGASSLSFRNCGRVFTTTIVSLACTKTRNNETKRPKRNDRNDQNEPTETTETSETSETAETKPPKRAKQAKRAKIYEKVKKYGLFLAPTIDPHV